MNMESKFQLKSKLVDGLLTPFILVLLSVLLALLIRPIEIIFQRPGLLIYTVILLALGILSLERCLVPRYPEEIRAWWGMVGGLLTWAVIEMSNFIGAHGLTNDTGMVSLMLVGLVVGVLWRSILPLGVKFFAIALLGGWVGHLGLYYVGILVNMNPVQGGLGVFPMISIVILGLALIILLWIFIQSKTRLSRLWGALFFWICVMLLVYIFRGGII
jgi:hypothetical protein